MRIFIYANCQGRGVQLLLEQYFKMAGREVHFDVVENFTTLASGTIDEVALRQADVFIYQPIPRKHGAKSSDHLLSLLRPGCVQIAFPYIYNNAFWPLVRTEGGFLNHEVIVGLANEGLSLEEITRRFYAREIDFGFAQRYAVCMAVLKEREQHCDVTISSYIRDNFRTRRLFLTQNHPTTDVFINIVNQILFILGFSESVQGDNLALNIAGLPGEWFHSTYDIDHYRFEFHVPCNNFYYANTIARIYHGLDRTSASS